MLTSTHSTTAVAVVAVLSLFGAVHASPIQEYNAQQLNDLWAAAAAATTPSHDNDSPISGVTVTLKGTPLKATSAVGAAAAAPAAVAPPIITGRPFRPPFLPPWLTGGIGAGGTLPPGWGAGPLTAGAVCGPYTLPVNLPFSPPCPFSTTTSKEAEEPEPTEPALPGTTIHPSTHTAPTATPPGPPESSTVSHPPPPPPPPPPVSSTSLITPTPRPSDSTTTSIIKTLPPTTQPAAGNPTQVIVTVSVTLRPDPPYTPGPAGERPKTTLATVKRG